MKSPKLVLCNQKPKIHTTTALPSLANSASTYNSNATGEYKDARSGLVLSKSYHMKCTSCHKKFQSKFVVEITLWVEIMIVEMTTLPEDQNYTAFDV